MWGEEVTWQWKDVRWGGNMTVEGYIVKSTYGPSYDWYVTIPQWCYTCFWVTCFTKNVITFEGTWFLKRICWCPKWPPWRDLSIPYIIFRLIPHIKKVMTDFVHHRTYVNVRTYVTQGRNTCAKSTYGPYTSMIWPHVNDIMSKTPFWVVYFTKNSLSHEASTFWKRIDRQKNRLREIYIFR